MVSIVYSLVCLTKVSVQGMFSMSIPVEDCLKKEAGGKRGTPEKIDPPKVALK
jgi:hypothetical protein